MATFSDHSVDLYKIRSHDVQYDFSNSYIISSQFETSTDQENYTLNYPDKLADKCTCANKKTPLCRFAWLDGTFVLRVWWVAMRSERGSQWSRSEGEKGEWSTTHGKHLAQPLFCRATERLQQIEPLCVCVRVRACLRTT